MDTVTYQFVDKPAQVQELINEFELDQDLKQKGLLGLDGKLYLKSIELLKNLI